MAIQTNHHWPQKVHRRSARVSFILLHLVAKHVWRSRQLVWRCCTHCCKVAFREERRREACDQWQTHALAACANAAPPRAGARRVATKCNPSPPPASLPALPRARRRHERTRRISAFHTARANGPCADWAACHVVCLHQTSRSYRCAIRRRPSGPSVELERAWDRHTAIRSSLVSHFGETRGRGEAELPSSSLQPFFSRPPVRS